MLTLGCGATGGLWGIHLQCRPGMGRTIEAPDGATPAGVGRVRVGFGSTGIAALNPRLTMGVSPPG